MSVNESLAVGVGHSCSGDDGAGQGRSDGGESEKNVLHFWMIGTSVDGGWFLQTELSYKFISAKEIVGLPLYFYYWTYEYA